MSRFTFNAKRILLGVMLLVAVPVSPVEAVAATAERSPRGNKGRGVEELRLEDRYAISAAMGREFKAYHIEAKSEGLRGTNTAQSLTAGFSPEGVEVRTGKGLLRLTLSAWGYGDTLRPVTPVRPQAVENRVEYRRGLLTEWYVNGPFGLQQGFSVEAPPPGGGDGERPLRLSLALGGGLRAELDQDQRGLVLHGRDGTEVLQYRGLTVTDSGGRQARSWLEVRGDLVLVNVDERGMRYPLTIDPFIQSRERVKLTASDGAASDFFGCSVAVSGDVVVVGAYGANGEQGSAYVFVKPVTGQPSMTQTAKLAALDGAGHDYFGCSVAVSGDVVVVGARAANSGQGSAYVFVKPGGGWADMTQTAKLTASDGAGGDGFGVSVAVNGDVVVVGAYSDEIGANEYKGSAYVFVKPGGGWANMTQMAKLTASDGAGSDYFGYSVAVSGDVVVVGAYGDDIGANGEQGSAYVFVKPGGGWANMTQTAKLTASDGGAGDWFGRSVAVNGDVVVVGACRDAIGANGAQGSAYVFVKPGGGWADMAQTAKLTASDGGAGDQFGYSVAVSGGVVVVGAVNDGIGANLGQGSAYVFVKPPGGWATTSAYTAKLTASDGGAGDGFGVSVAVNGGVVVVGAYGDDIGANDAQGSAYVYLSGEVTAGGYHTIGLKSDGTVVAAGDNSYGQCNVSTWSGIVQVAGGGFHSLGLRSDGTVVATGDNAFYQLNVTGWSGIVQLAAGYFHTVGLKSDGTVVATGDNRALQCNVTGWSGIVQVAGAGSHTLGVKSDGTVVAAGRYSEGQCNVYGWSGIVQVDAGLQHTVGLKADGTVVATGSNSLGQCNVTGWTGIVQVAAGDPHTVGLKADGTVVAAGSNGYGECNVSTWTGIVQVAAGDAHTVGLKSNGTVVATGDNIWGQCNVTGWRLGSPTTQGMFYVIPSRKGGRAVVYLE